MCLFSEVTIVQLVLCQCGIFFSGEYTCCLAVGPTCKTKKQLAVIVFFYGNKIRKLIFVYPFGLLQCLLMKINLSKDSSPLECDTVLLVEWCPVFWRIVIPSSSRVKESKKAYSHFFQPEISPENAVHGVLHFNQIRLKSSSSDIVVVVHVMVIVVVVTLLMEVVVVVVTQCH
jgi:hypothetical protein